MGRRTGMPRTESRGQADEAGEIRDESATQSENARENAGRPESAG